MDKEEEKSIQFLKSRIEVLCKWDMLNYCPTNTYEYQQSKTKSLS